MLCVRDFVRCVCHVGNVLVLYIKKQPREFQQVETCLELRTIGKIVNGFNSFMTEVPILQKPVHWSGKVTVHKVNHKNLDVQKSS